MQEKKADDTSQASAANAADKTASQKGLPGLLFRQVCLLAALTGVLASREPGAGLACFFIVLIGAGRMPLLRFLMLTTCFPAGWAYALWTAPTPPESMPDWFRPAAYEQVTGTVAAVSGQPDRRLRVLLRGVRPTDKPDAEALPGMVNLSWDQGTDPDLPRPLPGQTVTLTAKLRPVSGFANEGVSDSSAYWAARDVWTSAWISTTMPPERRTVSISGQPSAASISRENLRSAMTAALGGSSPVLLGGRKSDKDKIPALSGMDQARAVLPALLFGDRYGLDSATLDLFVRANLVHSLALSGQHLALAGLAAALLVWLTGRSRADVFLRVPRRTLLLCLSAPLAALYLWLGNAPLSLIRAALMMFFGLLLWLGKRPSTLLDLLFLAAFCFLLAWPQAFFDLSVQLSMLSVAGIALASPLLRRVGRRPVRGLAEKLVRNACLLLITSISVQIATLPVLLAAFGRVSPLFPLNLLWLPVLELAVMPLAALGLLLLPVFGPNPATEGLFSLAAAPTRLLIEFLTLLRDHDCLVVWQGLKPSGLSMAGYAAAVAAGAIALAAMRPKQKPASPLHASSVFSGLGLSGLDVCGRLALCAALLLPLGAWTREADAWLAARQNRVVLRALDVGQGQSLILEWPGGRLALDGGGSLSPRFDPGRDIVAHALTANRPPRLNMVIASHADMDHARGLAVLLEYFDTREFVHSSAPFAAVSGDGAKLEAIRQQRGIPLRELNAHDTVALGPDLRLEVLHPPRNGRRLSVNNNSLVIRLARRDGEQWHGLALLCGDAQIPALRALLRSGADLRAEILVIPHHGSSGSLLPEFYDAVSPRWAIISRSAYNSFGFPRADVLQVLHSRHIAVLDTAVHGEIRLTWSARSAPKIRVFRAETNALEQ